MATEIEALRAVAEAAKEWQAWMQLGQQTRDSLGSPQRDLWDAVDALRAAENAAGEMHTVTDEKAILAVLKVLPDGTRVRATQFRLDGEHSGTIGSAGIRRGFLPEDRSLLWDGREAWYGCVTSLTFPVSALPADFDRASIGLVASSSPTPTPTSPSSPATEAKDDPKAADWLECSDRSQIPGILDRLRVGAEAEGDVDPSWAGGASTIKGTVVARTGGHRVKAGLFNHRDMLIRLRYRASDLTGSTVTMRETEDGPAVTMPLVGTLNNTDGSAAPNEQDGAKVCNVTWEGFDALAQQLAGLKADVKFLIESGKSDRYNHQRLVLDVQQLQRRLDESEASKPTPPAAKEGRYEVRWSGRHAAWDICKKGADLVTARVHTTKEATKDEGKTIAVAVAAALNGGA